jgi:hypothetical protein
MMRGVMVMSKQEMDIFKNFKPISGDERKKGQLYKEMSKHQSATRSTNYFKRKRVLSFVASGIAIMLFFISIPLFVTNDISPGVQPEKDRPLIEITKRHDVYVGEGSKWNAVYEVDSVEAWINEDKIDYESWHTTSGEIVYLGENPGNIKEISYVLGKGSGESGGNASFEHPFDGKYNIGGSGGNGSFSKDKELELTVEWDGEREVITLKRDDTQSTLKEYSRSTKVSPVEPMEHEKNIYGGAFFEVAGDGAFQIGSMKWDALMKNMREFAPYLVQQNQSQNVLLMFADLTNISEKLTIKGKHESGSEQTLYVAPIQENAIESFIAHDFVIPANLSFNKTGLWTVTAYEGKKEVGTVVLDVQNEPLDSDTTRLNSESEGLVRSYFTSLITHVKEKDGLTTLYTGEDHTQKMMWEFHVPEIKEVIIQGLHESGKHSFAKTYDSFAMGDSEEAFKAVDSMQFDQEGIWTITVYSNDSFIGEFVLNVEHTK